MRPILALTLAASVIATGLIVSAQPAPGAANLFPYDDPEAVQRGEAIYAEYCASCHGANLEGQDNWQIRGADGKLPAPPHDLSGHTWHHPDVQLFQIVFMGTAALVGNGYESDMVGYGDILTEQEIIDVMAFIKSTWPDDIIRRHNQMNEAVAASQ